MKLVRVSDQAADFLQLVERYGLVPGTCVEVVGRDEQADTVTVSPVDGELVQLGFRAASKIQVSPENGT
jgi:hypothetical protein